MGSLDSNLGKRRSRRNKRNKQAAQRKKRNKPVSVLAILLAIFAGIIYVYFSKALQKGKAEEILTPSYEQVKQSMIDLDGIDILVSNININEKKDIIGQDDYEEASDEGYRDNIVLNPGILDSNIKYYLRKEGIDFYQVGLVYYNLSDNTYMGLNESEEFLAASTSKVPMVMYLYDLVYSDGIDLDQSLMVGEHHMEGGTGIIQDSGPGSTYTLYELSELAITHSDNVATNMLYGYVGNYIGEYLLDALAREYGISTYGGNYLTPDDAIMILDRLYRNEYANPYYYDLIDHMENTVYNDYFTKNINVDDIAHKTGDFDGYYNDIGIVFDGNSPYAFAVFTNNVSDPIEVLNDLGEIVHSWHRGENN